MFSITDNACTDKSITNLITDLERTHQELSFDI